MPGLLQLPADRTLPFQRQTAARKQLEEVASKRSSRLLGRWRHSGIVLGLGLGLSVGGGVALAHGVFSVPGASSDTQLAPTVIATRTGPATIELGPAPQKANDVSLTLTGLTVGTFRFPDGSSLGCSASDISHPGPHGCQASEVMPLPPGHPAVTITTSSTSRWTLEAAYVKQVITPWKSNAQGETYGAPNTKGFPDLVGVSFDRGRIGYVKLTDLNCAAGGLPQTQTPAQALANQKAREGRNVSIPVYESDGKTRIGRFIVGERTPGTRTVPISALDCTAR